MISCRIMKTSELDYDLPEALIAQRPAAARDQSRLLVVDRQTRNFREDVFGNIATYLRAGDCLAINNTRVIRARLFGHKDTGGRVEVFLLRELQDGDWEALVRPSSRVKPGTGVIFSGDVKANVEEPIEQGRRRVRFNVPDVLDRLTELGEIPLPPYIKRDHPEPQDGERYQTVYARNPGAVAAPTAGLHYTPALLEALERAGVHRVELTLHVGYGTFRPITMADVEDHVVEPEEFDLSREVASRLNGIRNAGGRIVAVGTTVTRVLETQYDGVFVSNSGITDKFIHPPYEFQAVDVLQTNFHLPKSSLLALVCAFAGRDLVMDAYRYAIERRFRFYSYGDTMLIL